MKSQLTDIVSEKQYLLEALSDPRVFDKYPVSVQDFASSDTAAVLRIAVLLRERGEPCGSLEVIREAKKQNVVLADDAPLWGVPATHPVGAWRRIRELATARRIRALALNVAGECESLRIDSAIELLREAVDGFKISESNIERSSDTVKRIIEEVFAGKRASLTRTGIQAIDSVIGGIEPGTLTFIGGDTGVGKSSLMLYMADQMALAGSKPGFISCEDSRQVLGTRIVSAFSGVSGLALRRGGLDLKINYDALSRAVSVAANRPLPIAYEIGSDDLKISQAMTALVKEHGCDTIFVDYIQTINCAEGGESRREDVRRIASRLKGTAARLGVPVIVGSQISVGDIHADFKEPGKHALKESRDLTNMAEWVIVIWRSPDMQKPEIVKDSRGYAVNVIHSRPEICGKLAKSKCGGDGTRFYFTRNRAGVVVECDEQSTQLVTDYDPAPAKTNHHDDWGDDAF